MKRNILLALASAVILMAASCQKTPVSAEKGIGYLSFNEFTLGLDEEVDTKASPANGNYTITIYDADENLVMQKSYTEVKNNDNKISLTAGSYTLVASSSAEEVPVAAFEQPVYGATKVFQIEAGMETSIGEVVCTLVQCKVTVSYSDEFLATVTGPCTTSVEITSGSPLVYNLAANGTYDQSAGYFAVSGTTMTIVFKGSIDGKSKSMTKVYSNVAPKQWRQIKFIQMVNAQGDATFDIVINDLIGDAVLNGTQNAEEIITGEDPEAPKGDGGITLLPDYEAGCDAEITDLTNMYIYPLAEKDMSIKLKAIVPGKVKKFTVTIESTNESFLAAVDAAQARNLNLISPSEDNAIIFEVVPFPHGAELLGQTEIAFDLSSAQDAIVGYLGVHNFKMLIVDEEGCRNEIPVVMIVGE